MASLTAEVQQLIKRDRLGAPLTIYGPHTISSIIGGLFLMAFAVLWTGFALFIMGNPLLPTDLSITTLLLHTLPSSFPSNRAVSTFNSIFTIFRIVFPLFGVLFFVFSFWIIISAIYNQGMRVAVCTYGVAFVKPSDSASFYWQDVLTGFHKVDVSTHTTHNQSTGATTTRTNVRHTYTVHCHDGRTFVFKSPLARVQDLAEDIEVQVARMKHVQDQRRSYEIGRSFPT